MANAKEALEKFEKHHPKGFFIQRSNEEVFDMLDTIKEILVVKEETIEHLQSKLKEAKEDAYASQEMQKMKKELEEARNDLYRGFGISEKEADAIEKWKEKHEAKVHYLITLQDRVRAGGAIGGTYTYEFIPTTIGTIGTCKCTRCKGKPQGSFTFSEI